MQPAPATEETAPAAASPGPQVPARRERTAGSAGNGEGDLAPAGGRRPAAARMDATDCALLGLAMLLGAALAATIFRPAEEDAFIYYRYALHAAQGAGLVFNAGDPIEGWSSPLWMAVVALLARLGCNLPLVVPALGIACGAAAVAATHALARRVGLDRFACHAAAFVVALSYPFQLWARSGLETPLYSLLLTAAVTLYLAAEEPPPADPARRHRLQLAGGVVLALVALGRPEGLLLVAAVTVDRLRAGGDRRALVRWLLPLAVIYGLYLAWRLRTFGALTPSTSVKLAPNLVSRSWRQTLGWVEMLGILPPLLPAAALLWGRLCRTDRRQLRFLAAAVLLVSVGFELLAGGDYRPGFRFLVPTLPILSVAIWRAAEALAAARSAAGRPLDRAPVRLLLLVLMLALSAQAVSLNLPRPGEWRDLVRRWRDPFADPADFRNAIAAWTLRHVPPDSLVAFGQMGKVPYYAAAHGHEVRFLDTLGLVDRDVASIYRLDRRLAVLAADLAAGQSWTQALASGRRQRSTTFAALLLARRPDFIYVESYLSTYGFTQSILSQPVFAARYREIAAIPDRGQGPLAVEIYALRDPAPPPTVSLPPKGE